MTRKSILILGVIVVLVVAGVFTVAAQSDTTTPTPTCPGIGQGGRGAMMGGGFGNGMMMGADGDTMMTAVAKVLGLEPAAFIEKLHSGQTLAQIAEAQGVKVQDVYDVILAQAQAHMALRVKDGTMTQAQADAHLTWMRDNIATMPMFGGAGAGNCTGMAGMMGNGMMGRGHGMMGNGMMGRGHGMMGNGNNT